MTVNATNLSKAYFTLSVLTCPSIPLSGNQSRQCERPPRALILSSGQTTSIRRPRLIASYTWFGSWICKHNVATKQPSCKRILHTSITMSVNAQQTSTHTTHFKERYVYDDRIHEFWRTVSINSPGFDQSPNHCTQTGKHKFLQNYDIPEFLQSLYYKFNNLWSIAVCPSRRRSQLSCTQKHHPHRWLNGK